MKKLKIKIEGEDRIALVKGLFSLDEADAMFKKLRRKMD